MAIRHLVWDRISIISQKAASDEVVPGLFFVPCPVSLYPVTPVFTDACCCPHDDRHLTDSDLTPQEKRKIPPLPNGVTDLGESEEHGGHGGPELQRTGR